MPFDLKFKILKFEILFRFLNYLQTKIIHMFFYQRVMHESQNLLWPTHANLVICINELARETSTNIAELGNTIRDMPVSTREGVTNIKGTTDIAGPHRKLQSLSKIIRNPYVDPIKAELLKRVRSMDDDSKLSKEELVEKWLTQDVLIVSIKGVVQGVRNSG